MGSLTGEHGATLVGHWLDGAAQPLARVLAKLTPREQEAFLKAMDMLETELHRQDSDGPTASPSPQPQPGARSTCGTRSAG